MVRRWGLGLLVLLLTLGVLLAQKPEEKPTTATAAQTAPKGPHNYNLTAEDKARKNPVAFTENSVARGKKLYQSQCAMCHGQNADGKGEVVEEMKINPPTSPNPRPSRSAPTATCSLFWERGQTPCPLRAPG